MQLTAIFQQNIKNAILILAFFNVNALDSILLIYSIVKALEANLFHVHPIWNGYYLCARGKEDREKYIKR